MGRPKGSRNTPTEDTKIVPDVPIERSGESGDEIATQDTWRYHETHEPRIFVEGESIPKGWNLLNASLWHRTPFGEWKRIEV